MIRYLSLLGMLAMVGCSSVQKRELDLLRMGAPVFEPGVHTLQCLDTNKKVELNVEKSQPVCIQTWGVPNGEK